MSLHKQTSVSVNINKGSTKKIIEVDDNMKNIVATLYKFNGLDPIECCQGDDVNTPSWICFRYMHWEHHYQGLVDFVFGFLAPHLIERFGDSVAISVYAAPSGNIFGELSIRPGTIKMMEIVLEDAFKLFNKRR